MRLSVLIGFLFLSFGKLSTQNSEVYTIVENAAEFQGGVTEMMNYLRTNIKYPAIGREMSIGGKVFIKFVVNEDGSISNAEVIKSAGFNQLDAEAIRVVNLMPKWKPANISGKDVKCYFNLPVNFNLDTPYFLFNPNNKNEKYQLANEAIIAKDLEQALKFYQLDPGDVEAWFNLGVLHFLRNNKTESKKYFETVKANSQNSSDSYYVLSNRFLTKNF